MKKTIILLLLLLSCFFLNSNEEVIPVISSGNFEYYKTLEIPNLTLDNLIEKKKDFIVTEVIPYINPVYHTEISIKFENTDQVKEAYLNFLLEQDWISEYYKYKTYPIKIIKIKGYFLNNQQTTINENY
ncbi:MAG: hypothetical protein RSD09_01605 [Bacilli bacterium]